MTRELLAGPCCAADRVDRADTHAGSAPHTVGVVDTRAPIQLGLNSPCGAELRADVAGGRLLCATQALACQRNDVAASKIRETGVILLFDSQCQQFSVHDNSIAIRIIWWGLIVARGAMKGYEGYDNDYNT